MKEKIIIDICLKDKIPVFKEHIINYSKEIISLAGEKNMEEIKRLAHNIKGAGGGYGFDKISEIGEEMEKACVDCDLGLIKKKAEELSVYFENLEIVYE